MPLHPDLEKKLREAIKHFWKTRQKQARKQGAKTGARDAGARTAVTGGHQMDGFINLVRDYLCANGLPKAQVGSFGNNYNNRTEEAIGSATDIWAAFREGAFKPSARPWLGYMMLLEEAPASMRPVKAREPHFKVFPEFIDASYGKRYEILLTKLVRERLYDSACFLLSNAKSGAKGDYREPAAELTFDKFIASLLARATAIAKTRKPN